MLNTPIAFSSDTESHNHSLQTLSELENHADFMLSIDTMADVGCGSGLDLAWWASRTVLDDDERNIPLDIKCIGIDQLKSLSIANQYTNISYQRSDIEAPPNKKANFDVLWCHDVLQYMINPLQVLGYFYDMLTPSGMLAVAIPQTTNIVYHKQEYNQMDFQYYNYTMVNLIHMLSMSGFDCKSGFFKKSFEDPWLHAIVYKSEFGPHNPRTTRWFDLLEKELLPESVERSIIKCGHVRQQDLVLPWINRSYTSFAE